MIDFEIPLIRVGIIGDPHTEDKLLAEAIRFLRSEGVNVLLCTGDVTDGEGDINRCCHLLEENSVYTVRGNHDRWFFELEPFRNVEFPGPQLTLEARTFLMTLPKTARFSTPQGSLLLCHGLGENDMAGIFPDDKGIALESNHALHALVGGKEFRFVVNGHTHARMVRTIEETTFINAGTLRWGYPQHIVLADFLLKTVTFFEFDTAGEVIPDGEVFPLS